MTDLHLRQSIADQARNPVVLVLAELHTSPTGLTVQEATRRQVLFGPNAVRSHRSSACPVLARQLRSPILMLLFATAGLSLFLGDVTNSIVIAVILLASIGLGFINEYRAERAAEAVHDRVSHQVVVLREGARQVEVTELVPGDVVRLSLGAVVPADIRLLECEDLACDEGILTGESAMVQKSPLPVSGGATLGDLTSCVFMGTVVSAGSCSGVVVATGGSTEFGRIALGLGQTQPQTEFQRGLSRFSALLLQVAFVLTSLIFLVNVLLQRPLLESFLFSLAIAVGITPQLLPAVVSTSLATGARQLARQKVLVKRLVSIEDLGDMDVLVTDKTGTLTEGRVSFTGALAAGALSGSLAGAADAGAATLLDVFGLGLLATEVDYSQTPVSTVGVNALDAALWDSPQALTFVPGRYVRLDTMPFDHQRRMTSVLVEDDQGARLLVSKGAPEDLLRRCSEVPAGAQELLDQQFEAGARVVAVGSRLFSPAAGEAGPRTISPADEKDLVLAGFLIFLDRPKGDARQSLKRLADLGITVKIATGDNARVAERVCSDLGLTSGSTLTGVEIEELSDPELADLVGETLIFARVSPEQKARVIRLLRANGSAVGFLGDGVNDALALHDADIGISVDTATDVAKDAADVVLLDKDLGVLADGVTEGRRIFANTIKYVLMGTSSNFGNMFSAAAASVVLNFLPLLPGQILLNNLLYDSGQLAIPGDQVDPEQLVAPSHWDIAFIRRFMFVFGGISSLFDFATFTLMLTVFSATPEEFRSGWFIESIATQTLIIFAIRTRRVPFFRSRASTGLTLAALGVVAVGVWLPYSPVNDVLGFTPLPTAFLLALAGMTVVYLVLVEAAKVWFYSRLAPRPAAIHRPAARKRPRSHRIGRRAARFSSVLTVAAATTRHRRRQASGPTLPPVPAGLPPTDLPGPPQ